MIYTGMTTPLCAHCGRPVVSGAVHAGGLAYHLECTHGPSGAMTYQAPGLTAEKVREIVREELSRMTHNEV